MAAVASAADTANHAATTGADFDVLALERPVPPPEVVAHWKRTVAWRDTFDDFIRDSGNELDARDALRAAHVVAHSCLTLARAGDVLTGARCAPALSMSTNVARIAAADALAAGVTTTLPLRWWGLSLPWASGVSAPAFSRRAHCSPG